MLVVRTSKCRAYSVGQLIGTKQTVGFDHFSLAMYPFGLHSVEPRALLGQQTADDPHSLLLALFQSPVAPTDPPSDLPAYVPTCVVPDQHQHLLADGGQLLAAPLQKARGYTAHRTTVHKAQPRIFELGYVQSILQLDALSRSYSGVVRRLSTQRHLMLTPSFCTRCHPIFFTHPARIPALRRSAFIFPSRNSASTTPSARFVGSSPVAALTVQDTPSRATCFFVRSMLTSSAKYSVRKERIPALPLYRPFPGKGADDTSSASSAKKAITASWSLLLQAFSKASAARNSSARASPCDIRSSMKRGSRFSFEAVPNEREKRERANSITHTTICLYLPPGERRPSSSSSSIFSMERSSW